MKKALLIVFTLALAAGGLALTLGPFPQSALGDPVFYNELGVMLSGEGKMAEAQAAFAEAVDLDPGYENARKNLYVSAFRNGDYLTAGEHACVLADEHDDAQYHFDCAQGLVAWARNDATDVDAAVAALEEAIVHLDAADSWPHAEENLVIVKSVLANA